MKSLQICNKMKLTLIYKSTLKTFRCCEINKNHRDLVSSDPRFCNKAPYRKSGNMLIYRADPAGREECNLILTIHKYCLQPRLPDPRRSPPRTTIL